MAKRGIGCLAFRGLSPQKGNVISGSFAERDLQLNYRMAKRGIRCLTFRGFFPQKGDVM